MQINVKEAVEIKTSRGNPMLQVVTSDGARLGCFHASLFPLLQPGNTVEVETEQRGSYNPNIISAVVPGEVSYEEETQTQERTEPETRSRGREGSIEAQTAAKNITELICAGKIEVSGLAGQLAMAWNIGKLRAALPEEIVAMVSERAKKEKSG